MIAVIFPGQGSQRPGMGQELYSMFPLARHVFQRVSDAIGQDVKHLCFDLSEEELRQTESAQIALFTCGLAAYAVLKDQTGISADCFAGHSVGEYAAVTSAGVFELEVGAQLVQKRGELMSQAREGAMAAVLGIERENLEPLLEGEVVIANDNCPGQLVISGNPVAVKVAGEKAIAAGAKRVLPLNVSGAFHSPLMLSASQEMGATLKRAPLESQTTPVYANVTSESVNDAQAWPDLLTEQLVSPVRWTESVQHMIRDGVTQFIECGSGEVLCGLIKRIDKTVPSLAVQGPDFSAVAGVNA